MTSVRVWDFTGSPLTVHFTPLKNKTIKLIKIMAQNPIKLCTHLFFVYVQNQMRILMYGLLELGFGY